MTYRIPASLNMLHSAGSLCNATMITAGFWCELVERRCFPGAVRTQSRRCMLCCRQWLCC